MVLKDSDKQIEIRLKIGIANSINTLLGPPPPQKK